MNITNCFATMGQDERYSMYIGKQAIVPMTFGRHVPIISDKVSSLNYKNCTTIIL